jgi:hypothetical protein
LSFSYHHRKGINVRNSVLATAVAAALALAAPQASAQAKGSVSKAEIQAIQAQMQALAERLNKLEAANTQLQTENQQLKVDVDRRDAEIDYLKSQTKELREESAVASNEISKVKGADWATRIKLKGDFRFRDENIAQERVVAAGDVGDAANQNRARLRVRAGLEAKVTDTTSVTLQIATGGDDPRSSNVTLNDEGTRKSIGLDLAYADWRYMQGGNLLLGKVKQPFWKPGQSLFFDNDYNPEGIATTVDRGMFFGTAYGWWLEENYNSNPANYNEDTFMLGVQAGLKFPLLGGETRVAAHYYDLIGGEGGNPFYNSNAYGNTTVTGTINGSATQVLAYDYNVIMLSGEMGLTLGQFPFALWADYAQNTAQGVDAGTAWAIGAMLGKASNPKTWEAGLFYESLDKDALFAQLVDSDFGAGITDAEGWGLKVGYAPVKNIVLNGTYFLNTRTVCGSGNSPSNQACGTGIPSYDLDYDRWQLDVNYKF